MKYLPTIDLWNAKTVEALKAGLVKLQPGQWVQCGKGPKSRWVGCKGLVLIVDHYPNASGSNYLNRCTLRTTMQVVK